MKTANRAILLAIVLFVLSSCGLSEEARLLEEKNLEIASRLRSLQDNVIPTLADHNDNLETALRHAESSAASVAEATTILYRAANVASAMTEHLNRPTFRQQDFLEQPSVIDEESVIRIMDAAATNIQRHNEAVVAAASAATVATALRTELDAAISDLESASESGSEVINAISDGIVESAEITDALVRELSETGELANSAAADARSIRQQADIANMVGGIVNTALLAIPGAGAFAGRIPVDAIPASERPDYGGFRFPQPNTPLPVDSDVPWGPLLAIIGTVTTAAAGTAVEVKRRKKKKAAANTCEQEAGVLETRPPAGPGRSTNAGLLGEAVLRIERERQEAEAASNREAIIEAELERRMAARAQQRQELYSTRKVPNGVLVDTQAPGRSDVYPLPQRNTG